MYSLVIAAGVDRLPVDRMAKLLGHMIAISKGLTPSARLLVQTCKKARETIASYPDLLDIIDTFPFGHADTITEALGGTWDKFTFNTRTDT